MVQGFTLAEIAKVLFARAAGDEQNIELACWVLTRLGYDRTGREVHREARDRPFWQGECDALEGPVEFLYNFAGALCAFNINPYLMREALDELEGKTVCPA